MRYNMSVQKQKDLPNPCNILFVIARDSILCSFAEGGCSPKFLIIDDGWQDITNEFRKEGELLVEGTQ